MLAETDQRLGRIESVSLAELVETAGPTVEVTGTELIVDKSIEILADKSAACQLMENLFANAIDHGGPSVTIRVGALDNGFYVEAMGRGLPPMNVNKYSSGDSVLREGITDSGWRSLRESSRHTNGM